MLCARSISDRRAGGRPDWVAPFARATNGLRLRSVRWHRGWSGLAGVGKRGAAVDGAIGWVAGELSGLHPGLAERSPERGLPRPLPCAPLTGGAGGGDR